MKPIVESDCLKQSARVMDDVGMKWHKLGEPLWQGDVIRKQRARIEELQAAIAALNVPALIQAERDACARIAEDHGQTIIAARIRGVWTEDDQKRHPSKITALEAANAAQSVRIATLLEDNHCIPELEARIKELETVLRFYANPPKGEPVPDFYDELDFGARAASALGDQHE